MIDHLQRLALFNQWANNRLFSALERLSEEEYKRKRPSTFGGIHPTLNHVLAVDMIWMSRIDNLKRGILRRTDEELCSHFSTLKMARKQEDAKIVERVHQLQPSDLEEIIRYVAFNGNALENTIEEILIHMSHHQTHHRGQIQVMLFQTHIEPPDLDLITYFRQKKSSHNE